MTSLSLPPLARLATLLAAVALALAGCAAPVSPIPPRPETPATPLGIDRTMSCEAAAASFHDAAVRVARQEDWIEAGPIASYGPDPFFAEVPERLAFERGRLDGLTVIQREKGCAVIDPLAAVASERRHRRPLPAGPVGSEPTVLRRLG